MLDIARSTADDSARAQGELLERAHTGRQRFNKQGACIDWTQTGVCSECAPWCDCARAARRTDVTRAQDQRGAQMQRSALVQRGTQYRCTHVTTAVNNVLSETASSAWVRDPL